MAATSVLINVGAATAGAVSELAKVDHALEGNQASAKSAAAVMKTQMGRQSQAMEDAARASKQAAGQVDSSMMKMGDGADTVASKGAQAAGALSGLGQLIGGPFGAAMQTAGVGMQAAADAGDLLNAAVEGGKQAFAAAKNAAAVFAKATGLQSAATRIAAATQAVFNAVMAANPIVLVIVAIVALIAIVILLWKNWDKVTKALGVAWSWLKTKAVAVFGAIKTFVTGVWQSMRTATMAVWNGLKSWLANIWNGIKDTAVKVFNYMKGLPGRILDAIGDANRMLYEWGRDLIKGLINGIKSMLGNVGNAIKGVIPDWVPGFDAATRAVWAAPAGLTTHATPHTASQAPSTHDPVIVTEEQVYRAVARLLMRGDARNGRVPVMR